VLLHPESNDEQFEFDLSRKLPSSAEEGMQRALDNSDPAWNRAVHSCVMTVARRIQKLSVDNVLDELDVVNETRKELGHPLFDTHNAAALGPVMKRAADDGVLISTGTTVRSKRPEKHGNRHTLWESKLFIAKEATDGTRSM
jgi:hypothetical protein